MNIIPLIGRVLMAFIFVASVPGLFGQPAIADAVAHGVPLASMAVPLAGAIALLGGMSVALGYQTRLGAALLVLFLLPVTWEMHDFWHFEGAVRVQQQINFLKNVALLGGVLAFAYFGAGPLSLDAIRRPKTVRSPKAGDCSC